MTIRAIFSPPRSDRSRSRFGGGNPAAREPRRRLAADRDRPPHRAGRGRRHHRRDGTVAGGASADGVGPVRGRGKPLRRRRHHRHRRSRAQQGRRPHHPGRQSRPQRDRLQHLPQHDLQGRPVAAGQQPDPDSEHRVGASLVPDQVDRGPDRLHQGQSGQADLRLVRRRAEPSPHRRLVPAAHRAEDGACAVPRRRSGAAGGAGRRYPDPVRQPLSDRCRRPRTASSTRSR